MSSTLAHRSWLLPGIPGARVMEVESLPARLADAVRLGPGLEARPGAVLITVPQIARYFVTNGVSIEIAPMPRADLAAVELFVDGPARAALIHERGEMPLLSTTVVSPAGKCVALCGGTGIGKSAVGAALIQRGWKLLAEGVTRVTLEDGKPVAQPSHESLRLWGETCDFLQIDSTGLRRVRAQLEKYNVPVPSLGSPMRVAAIVQLRPDPKLFGQDRELTNKSVVENSSYKPALASAVGAQRQYRQIVDAITDMCHFAVIDGAHSATVKDLATRIAQDIS